MSHCLSLFEQETQQVSIPCYCIKLVKESVVIYDHKRINGARTVSDLLMAIGLHEKACKKFYALYLSTKNIVIGIWMISRGTLNASVVHP
jgi:DNA repair protein RadC